jgi:predicted aspartyl protease
MIEVEALADTGAVYSVVRRGVLEQLGIRPLERRRFKAFGGYVERDVGEVGLVLLGRRRVVPIVFGEEGDVAVIGATALEIFGVEVDVVRGVRGVLKEAELLLLRLVDCVEKLAVRHPYHEGLRRRTRSEAGVRWCAKPTLADVR